MTPFSFSMAPNHTAGDDVIECSHPSSFSSLRGRKPKSTMNEQSSILDEPFRARLSRGRASNASHAENSTPRSMAPPSTLGFATDRFIPNRRGLDGETTASSTRRSYAPPPPPSFEPYSSSRNGGGFHSMLMRSELLGEDFPSHHDAPPPPPQSPLSPSSHMHTFTPSTPSVLFRRRSMATTPANNTSMLETSYLEVDSPLTPGRSSLSRSLLTSYSPTAHLPHTSRRKIPKTPFKILDAPGLADDFYLNTVEWSARNIIGVGLGPSIYLWSAHTASATKLDDIGQDEHVASLSFTETGNHLGVGTMSGRINLYDVETNQMVRYFDHAHVGRVGSISWNDAVLGTGGKDKCVREHDTRVGGRSAQIRCISFHKQEVCGLKYSFEGGSSQRMLASGGNDNKLAIWDARYVDSGAPPGEVIPLHKFSAHTAAVKAIAWSPHFTGVLASGGGTADRCIKVWSTQTGTMLSSMDTGSQVCGLVFSKSVQELVSTHGYSLNQICIWRAQNPKVHLHKIGTLQGHTLRVLYLGLSPDGSTIVTGAGDESLRFWSVWPGRSEGTSGSATRFTEMNLLDGVPGAYLR